MCARLTFRGDAAAAEALALLRPLADAGPALAAEVGAAEAAYNRYVLGGMLEAGSCLVCHDCVCCCS